eukprot:TRINITY_DN46654_c0_g1_i1.p2 TRINITY_DN46654_c0_g1~~TRINITY_DN46654_c0_g1_i1.p2  ORF type:complete len:126 (+),score=29.21 TRINITY_DN46654_c0_g1_i1:95-472(+)
MCIRDSLQLRNIHAYMEAFPLAVISGFYLGSCDSAGESRLDNVLACAVFACCLVCVLAVTLSKDCADNALNVPNTVYGGFRIFEVGVRVCEVALLSLIHISEPTRLLSISYAVFCLKKKTHIIFH